MRNLIRALIVVVVAVVVVLFVVFGSWTGSGLRGRAVDSPPAGRPGTIDVQKARDRGAELGEKAAVATAGVQNALSEAEVTGRIKAKMALDELVKARAIDVTTNGSTVTLAGTVASREEHDRAVTLSRETAGVTSVVDRLRISQ
jgi:hyperosmotically inducible periplasmic protein